MQIHKRPFTAIPQLSDRDVAYQTGEPALRPFYEYEVNLKAFAKAIEDRKHKSVNRKVLHGVLEDQYKAFEVPESVQRNIDLLKEENTFTVVTAHQPSLFTGPLYFIYKIASVLNLCKTLSDTYPDNNFVPVFIIGGEDHDFEEINHTNLFGNNLLWENAEKGSVGRMKTASMTAVLEQLYEILGDSPKAKEVKEMVENSFKKFDTYGKATAAFTMELMGRFGLVVINMDDAALKSTFKPVIRKEIFENTSKPLVDATKESLEKAGFSGQAHAREINFFYLGDQMRNRIVEEGGKYHIHDTDISFSREELEAEIENHPERFSPNVIMRPLYQESILPNLAYVGGGGELAYWLERKSQFAEFDVFFPMLIRRNSVLWVDKTNAKKMDSLGMDLDALFADTEAYIKTYVKEHADEPLNIREEKNQLVKVFDQITEKAGAIDQTLTGAVQAEKARQLKSLDNLEQRILRAEKQKHESAIKQIRNVYDKLFPGRGLQERHDNILNLYLRKGPEVIDYLVENLDPLDKNFLIVMDQ
ncbi:MAG: bacillithiol biosynthesis cysteine-adding enzyme BshC [Bacteroidetes bacterium]|nr:bacillithiol biosynthesis cysteine-adding enzyme BshC [Bacteroidota bacterium]